jgi:hypothetical protein
MALHSIIVRLGIAALLAREFSLSVFIVNEVFSARVNPAFLA